MKYSDLVEGANIANIGLNRKVWYRFGFRFPSYSFRSVVKHIETVKELYKCKHPVTGEYLTKESAMELIRQIEEQEKAEQLAEEAKKQAEIAANNSTSTTQTTSQTFRIPSTSTSSSASAAL
eukprot:TRINITY_DN1434_c0_g1_i4.p1 TRINITY_DN1434_c0_g1~~TRINITY_DN1434_c0_g1_i4.p1  ORF type:complete len:122 (-),score=41.29 TRINITY_DN1434_c0_g1_i4:99-464(-)